MTIVGYVVAVKSRRDEYSESTRAALLESGRRLFAERGYAGTSLADIAAQARVTKGALYHHFVGKQALLEEICRVLDQRVIAEVTAAMARAEDPWEGVLAAVGAFLDHCADPSYGRLVFREVPAVLGHAAWFAEGEATFGALIQQVLGGLVDMGVIDTPSVRLTAQVLYAALAEAALAIAAAADPTAERDALAGVLQKMMSGFLTTARPSGAPAQVLM